MQQRRLTLQERYTIAILLEEGYSQTEIAQRLHRDRSVISREIQRNSQGGKYLPEIANNLACHRQRQCHKHIKFTAEVVDLIRDYLLLDWSPEQISNYLDREHCISISVQRIYDYVGDDRLEGGTLYKHLRRGLKKKRKTYGKQDYRGQIVNRRSIDERPDIVASQERVGDFEIDTVIGKNHRGALVTIVDRKSLYTLIGKVERKEAQRVAAVTTSLLRQYSIHTITADNGKEFAAHEKISKELNCDFYFAHPYASWERAINENTNGLIRQYVPKGSSLDEIGDEQIEFIMERLNNRPRKKLGYKTPSQIFHQNILQSKACCTSN